jgi:PAS domain S-box-containing protein
MTTGSRTGADEEGMAERLLDGLGRGLALLDATGGIRLANRAAEVMFGYARGELAGRTLRDLQAPDAREAGVAERALAAARRDGRVEDEGERIRGDGSRVRVRTVLAPILAHPDAPTADGFTLEVREAGPRPEVETALGAREEILSTLSHELRTPLTAIMGWAHLLRKGNLDEKSRQRALETIERNAHLEAQLTADILDVARIVTGKLRLRMEDVDVVKIVESALESVGPSAQDKHVALRWTPEGTAAVSADPDRLQQVMANLLTNAVKFTPAGGEVHVRVIPGPETVAIVVRDTGEGIASEALPHLFDRLRRGRAPASGRGGLGMGLAIAHHLVERHAGRIHAESEGPGRGSTFTVELPSSVPRPVVAPAPAAPAAAVKTALPPLHGLTVLVVDDHEDARELMAAVLGRRGATVIAASSTAMALEALDHHHPDVILSDLEMPGEDGYSLIRKVRQRSPEQGGTVPAAALTAYARTEDRVQSLRAGFHRHVPKPVQPEELTEIVASLAGRRR